ncbi:SAM-dependent methyltransferase [Streptacidiphilus jiangxiensis]|uniref:S-adenosyl methyltransferase n=1 Tax=Streptacidiphilus jiangxiensis TaxID=235985 RepID=A0A1H7PC98_STRJI|nr:SAM-dependent methyltransferase [Streptacidiphilus jiangxiensis]SEL33078.1 S-adenosyl methyltransferase [Streptacidiphilus jiangxiensis]
MANGEHASPVFADPHQPPGTFEAARCYSEIVTPIHLRSRYEIAAMLSGWEVCAPGLVPIPDWHPDRAGADQLPRWHGLAAVGVKPSQP